MHILIFPSKTWAKKVQKLCMAKYGSRERDYYGVQPPGGAGPES